jgi:hypothetical protein
MSQPPSPSSSPQFQTLSFSSSRPPKAPLQSPITERFLRSQLNLAESSYRDLTAVCEAALSTKSQLLERYMRTPEDRAWYASELSAVCLFPASLVEELSTVVPDDTMRAWLLYCVGSRRRTVALVKRRKENRNIEVSQERPEDDDDWRNALRRGQQVYLPPFLPPSLSFSPLPDNLEILMLMWDGAATRSRGR